MQGFSAEKSSLRQSLAELLLQRAVAETLLGHEARQGQIGIARDGLPTQLSRLGHPPKGDQRRRAIKARPVSWKRQPALFRRYWAFSAISTTQSISAARRAML